MSIYIVSANLKKTANEKATTALLFIEASTEKYAEKAVRSIFPRRVASLSMFVKNKATAILRAFRRYFAWDNASTTRADFEALAAQGEWHVANGIDLGDIAKHYNEARQQELDQAAQVVTAILAKDTEGEASLRKRFGYVGNVVVRQEDIDAYLAKAAEAASQPVAVAVETEAIEAEPVAAAEVMVKKPKTQTAYVVEYRTRHNPNTRKFDEIHANSRLGAEQKLRKQLGKGMVRECWVSTPKEFAKAYLECLKNITLGTRLYTMSKGELESWLWDNTELPTWLVCLVVNNHTPTYPELLPKEDTKTIGEWTREALKTLSDVYVDEPLALEAEPTTEPIAEPAGFDLYPAMTTHVPTEDEIQDNLAEIEDRERILSAAHDALIDVETEAEFRAWLAAHPKLALVRKQDGQRMASHEPYPQKANVITITLENGKKSYPYFHVIGRYFMPVFA